MESNKMQGRVKEEPCDWKRTEEPSDMKMTEEPSHVKVAEEPSDRKMTEEPSDVKMTKEPSHVKVAEEPSHVKVAEEPSDMKMTEEPSDRKMTAEPSHVKITKEPSDRKMTKEPSDMKMTKEPSHVKVAEEPLHLKVAEESLHVKVAEEPSHVKVAEEPSHVRKEPSDMKMTKKPFDLKMTKKPFDLKMTKKPFDLKRTKKPSDFDMTEEACDLKLTVESCDVKVNEGRFDIKVKEEPQDSDESDSVSWGDSYSSRGSHKSKTPRVVLLQNNRSVPDISIKSEPGCDKKGRNTEVTQGTKMNDSLLEHGDYEKPHLQWSGNGSRRFALGTDRNCVSNSDLEKTKVKVEIDVADTAIDEERYQEKLFRQTLDVNNPRNIAVDDVDQHGQKSFRPDYFTTRSEEHALEIKSEPDTSSEGDIQTEQEAETAVEGKNLLSVMSFQEATSLKNKETHERKLLSKDKPRIPVQLQQPAGRKDTRKLHLRKNIKISQSCNDKNDEAMNTDADDDNLDSLPIHFMPVIKDKTSDEHLSGNASSHHSYAKEFFHLQCNICNEIFEKSQQKEHLSKHFSCSKHPFQCEECFKIFSCKSDLEKHSVVHTREKPFKCDFCPQQYAFRASLASHLKKKHGMSQSSDLKPFRKARSAPSVRSDKQLYQCLACGQMFDRLQSQKHCREDCTVFRCEQCPKVFKSREDLQKHSDTHRLKKFTYQQCDQCCLKFASVSHLEAHKEKAHYADMYYRCKVCPKAFHSSKECPVYSAKTDSGQTLSASVSSSHSKDETEGEKFHSSTSVGQNSVRVDDSKKSLFVASKTSGDSSGTEPIISCQKTVSLLPQGLKTDRATPVSNSPLSQSPTTLSNYVSSVSQNSAGKTSAVSVSLLSQSSTANRPSEHSNTFQLSPRKEAVSIPYQCKECAQVFSCLSEWIKHSKTHDGEKPFKCDLCKVSFALSTTLGAHRRKTHGKYKQFKCEECSTAFYSKERLESHMNVHREEKPHVCDICSMSFIHLYTLNEHKRIHSSQRPVKRSCPAEVSNPPEHVEKQKKVNREERPHKCDQCAASYKLSSHLEQHKRDHTGEKPFECDICGVAFTRSHVLQKHRKSHV